MKKNQSIFSLALKRLTFIYVWLAVLVTLTFTIPPMIAADRAREDFNPDDWSTTIVDQSGQVLELAPRLQTFVERRDDSYGRRLKTLLLEINGAMLLLAIGASYFLARRSLEPLSEVLDTQEQFAAELAHELKTPLATVLLELESFVRLNDNLTASQKNDLRQMARSIRDVGQLTEQTLSLISVERDGDPAKLTDCDLGEIAHQAVDLIAPAARAKKIKLVAPAADLAVVVPGRALQLRQLVTILLDNAIKFTPTGGQVTVAVSSEDKRAILSVTDTGPGIPEEEQAKIFQRWYQKDAEKGGAGLGLAIAQRIAQAHDGILTVSSADGQGACFQLVIKQS